MDQPSTRSGWDFEQGIADDELREGKPVAGHYRGEPVVLVRKGDSVLAVGGSCTHYGGPLADGLVVGETVRCPWHHARFSLRTGEAVAAPALNPLACFTVARAQERWRITGKAEPSLPVRRSREQPASVVIVGAGAAGSAAAETLRREGYDGPVTLVGADPSAPYDRPNLSKDYLAGKAPEEWIPLRAQDYYRANNLDLRLATLATAIDPKARTVTLANGEALPWSRLLLTTGARPRRLPIPGADRPHVLTLRSLADSHALIERARTARNVVVLGASFIGLEVAASLRMRGLAVQVVAPEEQPLGRIFGAPLGEMVRHLHEAQGVTFSLGCTPSAIEDGHVVVSDGRRLPADLVVMGTGVEPDIGLAARAGLTIDRGVKVNAYLETSEPGIFAAGDIARWPDPHTGRDLRVEHWVVAQRQGQTAARNLLGAQERFVAVPFFWSTHYDVTIAYVGHGEGWDRIEVDGDPKAHDCRVTYWKGQQRLAVATVGRDRDSLQAEAQMEAEVRST